MNKTIFKELQKNVFGKKFQNMGYLPRWIIFAIDVAIVAVASLITYIIIDSLNVDFDIFFNRPIQTIIILSINSVCFMLFRTYSGIIRHSTFIDGVKLLVATTCSYIVLLVSNYIFIYFFDIELFLPTSLFITYVISFLLLFLFRILVKNIFEKYLQTSATPNNTLIKAVIYGADANANSVANALRTERPGRFKLIAFV